MPLPNSGVMSLNMIRNEFGQSGNVSLSRYYRGGGLVPNSPKNYSISTGGRISHSMFYGASKELTPEEAAQLAAQGMYSFSRENSNWIGDDFAFYQSANYQNGVYNNAVFPDHKEGMAAWNFQWYFNNMGFAATDSKCMVVFIGGGRGCGAPGINYVRNVGGWNVGFRNIYSASWDDDRATGEAISIFEVDCDRREIAEINSYHSSWRWGRAHVSAVHILPGGGWGVLSISSYPNSNNSLLQAGEVAIFAMGGAAGGWNIGVGGADVLQCCAEWYNFCIAAMIYGNYAKYWNMNGPGMTYASRDPRIVTIRKFREGESSANRFIHNTWISVTNLSSSYVPLPMPGYGSDWTMYPGHVMWIDNGRGANAAEQSSIVSWSCDNPKVKPMLYKGKIYAGVDDAYGSDLEEDYSNFSITLRANVSGQQYSVSTGAGKVRMHYNQTGG